MKVLIGDTNSTDAAVAAVALAHAGFEVITRTALGDLLASVVGAHADLVIAASDLAADPGEVCRRLRRYSAVALMILAARASEDELICVLEAGADDYLAKPVPPAALVARAKALIRRSHLEQRAQVLTFRDVSIDLNERLMRRGQEDPVRLSAYEARLLQALMMSAGEIVPDRNLLDLIWEDEVEGGTARALKQLAHRVRVKLRNSGSELTVVRHPGVGGYVLQSAARTGDLASPLHDSE